MRIEWTYTCKHTGLMYRCALDSVTNWADEAYPPGGQLRVMRNAQGQMVAGPMVSEINSFRVTQ